jgi:hypothetical protein
VPQNVLSLHRVEVAITWSLPGKEVVIKDVLDHIQDMKGSIETRDTRSVKAVWKVIQGERVNTGTS